MQTARPALSGVRARLARGLGATSLSPFVTAGIQLAVVPVLLHSWGAVKYGEWLLLSTVPSYLTLSDAGLGDASGSDMTARVAAGDRQGAIVTFQSCWAMLTLVSLLLGFLASAAVWFMPWQHWLNLSAITDRHAATVILILGAWVLLGQQGSILESGFRCDGHFALGTLLGTVTRVIEAVIPTAVGVFTGRLLDVALACLFCRMAATVGYALVLRRVSPWLRFGFGRASLASAIGLIRPALGFIAFPAAQALNLQGFALLIGVTLGPAAVAAFTTMRTLSRVGYQAVCALSRAVWPEMSRAFGASDLRMARSLHRHAWRAALGASLLIAIGLRILGPWIYTHWTRHAVSFSAEAFQILLIVSLLGSLGYVSLVAPMSANVHLSVALSFLLATCLTLAGASVLTRRYGLDGAVTSLLPGEIITCALALRAALRQTHDTVRSFFNSVFRWFPLNPSARKYTAECNA